MEVVMLYGGGHIAELRLGSGTSGPAINCLWEAPWHTADPNDADFGMLADKYGSDPAGPFLAAYTGHALCLDIFGLPSIEEAAMNIPLHGEASARRWQLGSTANGCVALVTLPAAQLEFRRTLSLADRTGVLFVDECLENHGSEGREIHWVQHVSLGPPFVAPGESSIHASLDHGMTWPLGYEGHELLRDRTEFEWPMVPSVEFGNVSLESPFHRRGTGFVAAARVEPERQFGYVAALNRKLALALVYCFRREDFPWVAIWEENCARLGAPWNGIAQVRGMEFGTTPMPIGRDAIRRMGDLFDTPGSRVVPLSGTLRARYAACIMQVPTGWNSITDAVPADESLTLIGPGGGERTSIAAEGLLDFLLKGRKKE